MKISHFRLISIVVLFLLPLCRSASGQTTVPSIDNWSVGLTLQYGTGADSLKDSLPVIIGVGPETKTMMKPPQTPSPFSEPKQINAMILSGDRYEVEHIYKANENRSYVWLLKVEYDDNHTATNVSLCPDTTYFVNRSDNNLLIADSDSIDNWFEIKKNNTCISKLFTTEGNGKGERYFYIYYRYSTKSGSNMSYLISNNGKIWGRIFLKNTDRNTGNSGIEITLHNNGDSSVSDVTTLTSEKGIFSFDSIQSTDYTIVIKAKRYTLRKQNVSLSTGKAFLIINEPNAGDYKKNNAVNMDDFLVLKKCYGKTTTKTASTSECACFCEYYPDKPIDQGGCPRSGTDPCLDADGDNNGAINLQDFLVMQSGYGTEGDK